MNSRLHTIDVYPVIDNVTFCIAVLTKSAICKTCATEVEVKQFTDINNANLVERGDINTMKMEIYPNPANTFLHLNIEFTGGTNLLVEIYNCFGKYLYSESDKFTNYNYVGTIDLSTLTNGSYYLRLVSGNNSGIVPFIICK